MANTVTLKVDGLKTIQAALEGLPRTLQAQILGDALKAGGDVIKAGIAAKIHNRTGRTAADLRTEVQVNPDDIGGSSVIGGTKTKTGRAFVLRFLEHGTKPHLEPKKKKGQKFRITFGGITKTRRANPDAPPRLAFGGKVFSRVKHPGTHAQAPGRRTVAEQGIAAVNAFARVAWNGIRNALERSVTTTSGSNRG